MNNQNWCKPETMLPSKAKIEGDMDKFGYDANIEPSVQVLVCIGGSIRTAIYLHKSGNWKIEGYNSGSAIPECWMDIPEIPKDMLNNWYVTGDHPVRMRPDKYWLSYKEARRIAEEILDLGYENIVVSQKEY